MKDKGLEEIAAILFPAAAYLIPTKPDNPRAAGGEVLHTLAGNILTPEKIILTESAAEALQRAREVTSPEGSICVTGSLYLVGEIKAILNVAETTASVRGN